MSLHPLPRDAPRLTVYGASEPFAAWLCATQAESGGRVVVVAASDDLARRLATDIRFFRAQRAGDDPIAPPAALYLPALDVGPYAELSPDRATLAARMSGLYRLSHPELCPDVVVCSVESLIRKSLPPAELEKLTTTIASGGEIDRDRTAELLVRAGYARTQVVEDPGTFAVRGGVIDLFPSLYRYPVRIELFGDEVESIRTFDPDSQRTLRALEVVHIHPVRETIITEGADLRGRLLEAADRAAHPSKDTRRITQAADSGEEFVGIEVLTPAFHREMAPISDYLPDDATWFLFDPDRIDEQAGDLHELAEGRYRDRLNAHQLAFPPADHFVLPEQLDELLAARSQVVGIRPLELADQAPGQTVRFEVDDNHLLRRELERARRERATELIAPLADAIRRWQKDKLRVAIAAPSASRRQRLQALLREYDVELAKAAAKGLSDLAPGVPALITRPLSEGFTSHQERIAIVTEDEIFGDRRRTSARQREAARRARKALMGGAADFANLEIGNFLVHVVHGVGRYQGLVKLPVADTAIDFLNIEYRGGTLYLPVYRMGEVQRYVGAEGHEPKLDKLGGVTWEKSKGKVSKEVRALAEQLLQLYAQRAALPGHAYAEGDALFSEFEATFEFEETPDQKKAIDDVIADMEQPKPMDRLVCGDVGYGKTEVALRAMLKAVLGGRQVAMLAPTTVLVEQHYQNMRRRFAGWPMKLARLSRFQKRKEQLETVKGLAAGTIDAVVGTHRLLSKDIRFKELGLLIIDEEQRFGVAHKERLKRMRTQIDVLTLTATPIPRTLNLAMSGLRDLSIIATPPADRRSIRTFVARPEDQVIRDAVRKELSRGGQVFFVSPRIEGNRATEEPSLVEWAELIRELVPQARVAVAHGQMRETELEKVMLGFVDGDFDVLVCTTIVESGLDIPRANTMLVASADRFGLAQLYQLRGRIGRSKERAFCYLLVPARGKLTDDARRRLEALQRFSDLGAGFAIASRDLEIRGAGELLGARQSGSIAAVGFETYARLLEDAVAELRGEAISRATDPELNVSIPGFIPDDYVVDTGQRLQLYKRLANAQGEDDVAELLSEIEDRYGPLPDETRVLGDLMVLKGLGAGLHVQSLELGKDRMVLAFSQGAPIDPSKLLEMVQGDPGRYRLTPDMRLTCRLESKESNALASAKAVLLELAACVTS
jgi:transcription-repair coupling factor (superfamily II helicase)